MFFVNGATLASWAPRLPELQRELAISDAALGLTLVGMGLGGLAASSFSGWLVDRRGSRTTTVATSAAMSLWLPILGLAPTAVLVFASLLVLGALDGLTDVAMNSQAVELQRRVERSIITRFHAVWSAGAVAGGIVASRAAGAGISLRVAAAGHRRLSWPRSRSSRRAGCCPTAARPRRRGRRASAPTAGAVPIGRCSSRCSSIGMAVALAELPPNDWSALLISDRFDVTAGQAGPRASSPSPAACSSAG